MPALLESRQGRKVTSRADLSVRRGEAEGLDGHLVGWARARAAYDAPVATYQQTVLSSFQGVEDPSVTSRDHRLDHRADRRDHRDPDPRPTDGRRGPARPGPRRRLDGGRTSVLRGRDEAGGSGAEGAVRGSLWTLVPRPECPEVPGEGILFFPDCNRLVARDTPLKRLFVLRRGSHVQALAEIGVGVDVVHP